MLLVFVIHVAVHKILFGVWEYLYITTTALPIETVLQIIVYTHMILTALQNAGRPGEGLVCLLYV